MVKYLLRALKKVASFDSLKLIFEGSQIHEAEWSITPPSNPFLAILSSGNLFVIYQVAKINVISA